MGKAILVPPSKPSGKRPTKYSPPLVFMGIYFRQGTDSSMPFAIRGLLGNQLVVVSVLIAQQLGFAMDLPQSAIHDEPGSGQLVGLSTFQCAVCVWPATRI
jgi:hypothetical protein